MTEKGIIAKEFADDLDALVERYREEHHLAFGSIIGTLHLKSHILCQEALEVDKTGWGNMQPQP